MSLDAQTACLAIQSSSPAAETEYLATKARATQIQALNVTDRVRVRNRRKRWLEGHPEYYVDGELNDPLLYDRLIRRFQTPAEREAEGRKKGYSGVLEADLYRGEAKLHALRNPDPESEILYKRGTNGEILEEEEGDVPATKEEGMRRWREEMERRFLDGRDKGFDYDVVDGDVGLDDVKEEERTVEERYFGEESPMWADEEEGERELRGETGIQDF